MVIGTPTIGTGYDTFVAGSSEIDTGILPTAAMTFLVAAQIPTWTGTSPYDAVLIGNYKTTGYGISMFVGANLHCFVYGNITNLTEPTSGPGVPTSWFLAALRFTAGGTVTVENLTAGVTGTGTAGGFANAGNNTLRIGSEPAADVGTETPTSPNQMAFSAIWDYALTDSELAAATKTVRGYLSRYGIAP